MVDDSFKNVFIFETTVERVGAENNTLTNVETKK
jgi:hypothetical protein